MIGFGNRICMMAAGAMGILWLALAFTAYAPAPTPAHAQEAKFQPLTPPSANEPNRFRNALKNTPHRTIGSYLPKGAPLEIRKPPVRSRDTGPMDWTWERWMSVLVLVGVAILLLVWLWRSGILASPLNRKNEELGDGTASERFATTNSNARSRLTAQDVLAQANPKDGLQMFVGYVLEQAADATSLRLNRSFTAREILRRLPKSFAHGDALKSLVYQAEPVLFGDDQITHDELETLLTQHKALFGIGSVRKRTKTPMPLAVAPVTTAGLR